MPTNSGPVMPAALPVIAERLADRQDMRLVEGVVERRAAMPRGAERDPLGWNRRIRLPGEIGRHQPRNVGQHRRGCRLAGQRMKFGGHGDSFESLPAGRSIATDSEFWAKRRPMELALPSRVIRWQQLPRDHAWAICPFLSACSSHIPVMAKNPEPPKKSVKTPKSKRTGPRCSRSGRHWRNCSIPRSIAAKAAWARAPACSRRRTIHGTAAPVARPRRTAPGPRRADQ